MSYNKAVDFKSAYGTCNFKIANTSHVKLLLCYRQVCGKHHAMI